MQDARVAEQDRRADRRAVPGAVRSAHGVRRHRRRARRRSPLRVGRQELAFGEQRLVGHVSWLNAARTFDGAQGDAAHEGVAGRRVRRVGRAHPRRRVRQERQRQPLRRRLRARRAELMPHGDGRAVRVLAARREPAQRARRRSATLQQTTVGVRLAGRLPARLDYGVEMALQRGSLGTDDVSAWAGHWQLRESLPGHGRGQADRRIQLRVRRREPHRRRARHVRSALSHAATTSTGWPIRSAGGTSTTCAPASSSRRSRDCRSRRTTTPGGWPRRATASTRAGGALLARVAGGAADGHVGQEIDVQVTRALTPQLQLAAGYAHIFTGRVPQAGHAGRVLQPPVRHGRRTSSSRRNEMSRQTSDASSRRRSSRRRAPRPPAC